MIATEDDILAAILATIGEPATIDPEKLRSLRSRRVSEPEFFGDWYDPATGALLRIGEWQTDQSQTLHNPRLQDLEHVRIISGSGAIPDVGAGGQFAYAFTNPPYTLRTRPSEVQALFDEIRTFILPPNLQSDVLDWTSDRLPEVSDYFAAGMEWWGVFLFSIHVVALNRLTIIAGSTTD